jgi:hypothetical protein
MKSKSLDPLVLIYQLGVIFLVAVYPHWALTSQICAKIAKIFPTDRNNATDKSFSSVGLFPLG